MDPGLSSTDLIEQADRALLFGKQEGSAAGSRGLALPDAFRAGRFGRDRQPEPTPRPVRVAWPDNGPRPDRAAAQADPPAGAGQRTGTRLAAMTDPQAILDAAVDELHRAFGYFLCAVIRIAATTASSNASRAAGRPSTDSSSASGPSRGTWA